LERGSYWREVIIRELELLKGGLIEEGVIGEGCLLEKALIGWEHLLERGAY
jgi:hypothetical protein